MRRGVLPLHSTVAEAQCSVWELRGMLFAWCLRRCLPPFFHHIPHSHVLPSFRRRLPLWGKRVGHSSECALPAPEWELFWSSTS